MPASGNRHGGSVGRPPGAGDRIVLFAVRHGEKESGRDPSLTAVGERRADALAETLGEAAIDVIFSSDYRRCQQTVAPLAARRSIDLTVIEAADPHRQLAALRALPAGATVVLCGHANTVPMLIQALGGTIPDLEFGMIPEHVHDRLFVVTFPAGVAALPEETQVHVENYGARS